MTYRSLITNNFIPETANTYQTRQNGYQTIPFSVYIHNLMFVFIFKRQHAVAEPKATVYSVPERSI